jgi:hypothetical protein
MLLAGLLACAAPGASAQTEEPPEQREPAPPKLDAKACADREQLTLGDTHELQSNGTSGANPSDTLARTDGVICPPPYLDPDIRAPAPGGGRTPVIPPAGEGEPAVRPK